MKSDVAVNLDQFNVGTLRSLHKYVKNRYDNNVFFENFLTAYKASRFDADILKDIEKELEDHQTGLDLRTQVLKNTEKIETEIEIETTFPPYGTIVDDLVSNGHRFVLANGPAGKKIIS